MAAQLLDGKAMSAELREELALRVQRLKGKGVTPGLAVILVGDDPASQIYVKNKHQREGSLETFGAIPFMLCFSCSTR